MVKVIFVGVEVAFITRTVGSVGRAVMREAQVSDLKITEKKVLDLQFHLQMVRLSSLLG